MTDKGKKRMMDITVGYQCNQNCRFCSVGHKRKELNKSADDIKKDILYAKKLGIEVLGFGGGEPTIRKDIFEVVKFAKEQGFSTIRIQTNGLMFGYEWFAKKMIESGANYFKFSMSGHTAELHDYMSRVQGSFDSAIRGIKNLKELGQSVEVNIIITKQNYKLLPQIVNFYIEMGVSKFCFIYLTIVGNAKDNYKEVIPQMKEVIPYLTEVLELIDDLELDKALCFNIPVCMMEKYKEQLIEFSGFNALIANPERIEDIDEERFLGKSKGPGCKKCKYKKKCFGIWNHYTDIFGFEEFKPV